MTLTAPGNREAMPAAPRRAAFGSPASFGLRRTVADLRGRRAVRTAVKAAVALAALGVTGTMVARHGAELRRFPSVVASARPGWLLIAVWAELASMAAAARQQRRLLATAGIRMPLRRALQLTCAANAVSVTLPAGAAMAVVYQQREYRRFGVPPGVGAAVALIAGALSADALVGIGAVGVLLTDGAFAAWHWLAGVIATGCAGFAIVLWALLRHGGGGRRSGAQLARPPSRLRGLLAGWIADARALRPGLTQWVVVVLASLANWLADGLCLAASAHAVGLRVSVVHLVTGYCVGQVLISAPIVPGGLAVAESGMTAVLVGFGAPAAAALSAVLLYRLVSYWMFVGVGACCAARLRRIDSLSGGPDRLAPGV